MREKPKFFFVFTGVALAAAGDARGKQDPHIAQNHCLGLSSAPGRWSHFECFPLARSSNQDDDSSIAKVCVGNLLNVLALGVHHKATRRDERGVQLAGVFMARVSDETRFIALLQSEFIPGYVPGLVG